MEYSGPTSLYIDGDWVDAESGETIETFDPATEARYAEVACAEETDVDAAVEAAKSAAARGSEWRTMDPSTRGERLRAMADAIEARKDEISLVESHDNGKTPFEAGMEVQMVVDTFRYYAGWTDKVTGEYNAVPGDRVNFTTREPLGVTGHIVPWNYPFQLAGRSIAPALACGNTAVVKPSSQTPLSALYYGIAAEEAGLPEGVVNVVPGSGSTAGSALASHSDVEHVTFTGSTEIGKRVMADAAENVTGVTLELGGKGPHVVFPDADLDAAAKGVHYGIFMNAGQMCWAGSRLLVHEDVADELVEKIVQRAEATPLGSGIDDDGRMGPVVSENHMEDVLEYITIGVEEGATVACGGGVDEDKESGYFVEPTVLTDVTNDMTVAREEIFGPVLSVIEFSDQDEAIELANDSPYGLLAGIWTQGLSRAHQVADALDYGMVSVNEYPVTFPQTPFGGTKQSGHGREQGEEAVREFTQAKNINLNI
ncbi:aldehyde dehydrogenase family protein [Haloferax sp. MBLA0076]|uniref:Aldehyde dehydrogenase family protein n=1 Tax=Haloferax litoreum TaxID=2666140 RepID=A0A6A8GKJ8_9EURY|nr:MULTISPECIES: aldehyde dehydrogenase family protein [Haloferax]KAB1189880.1 aldehyde dehydrogenase family protein [Haloferax sp. CBA1148]MRX23645.1 aldehyde dehydrogenase family protein [Haloferax litoreum]